MKNLLIYTTGWIGMVAIAIFNGIVRQNIYAPYMSELSAHQLSTLSIIIFFGLLIFLMTRFFPLISKQQAILIGCIWLIMTICFEFLFGHYIAGHSWSKLFHDYNILSGRVWILVLIWVTFAPYIFYRTKF
mgnify:CR=1 FL=1